MKIKTNFSKFDKFPKLDLITGKIIDIKEIISTKKDNYGETFNVATILLRNNEDEMYATFYLKDDIICNVKDIVKFEGIVKMVKSVNDQGLQWLNYKISNIQNFCIVEKGT